MSVLRWYRLLLNVTETYCLYSNISSSFFKIVTANTVNGMANYRNANRFSVRVGGLSTSTGTLISVSAKYEVGKLGVDVFKVTSDNISIYQNIAIKNKFI